MNSYTEINNKNNDDVLKPDYIDVYNMNIQSLTNKIDELGVFLNEFTPDLVTITEHWMTDTSLAAINFENYSISSAFTRKERKHGGVLIMTKEHFKIKNLAIIDRFSKEIDFEATGIYIEEVKTILICIYRSPLGDFDKFLTALIDMLTVIINDYPEVNLIIAGDFNVNFIETTRNSTELTNVFASYGLKKMFNEPSRIGNSSATCIDNMFVSRGTLVVSADTTNLHMSDHLCQKMSLCCDTIPMKEKTSTYKIRDLNEINTYSFITKVSEIDWQTLLFRNDAHSNFNNFFHSFMETFDECFPEKQIIAYRNKKSTVEWRDDSDLKKMRNILDSVDIIRNVVKDVEISNLYDELKKDYKLELLKTKKEATAKYIMESNNKNRAIWDVIGRETRSKRKYSEMTQIAANDFNKYFSSIGDEVEMKNHPMQIAKDFLQTHFTSSTHSLFFNPTSKTEIIEIVKMLKRKKTVDIYGMNTCILKEVIEYTADPLTKIFNECLQQGIFPDQLKMARILPVFKGGDDQLSNYRPISILPAISKIFETIIKNRLVQYFDKYSLFNISQHGFVKGKSTATAIACVLEYVAEALDSGEETVVACCDLSKAFDTVDHKILIEKLQGYGVRGTANKLLESYLDNRKQIVEWNKIRSSTLKIKRGVPQGSILGPVLFLIYVNDMPYSVTKGSVIQYADDTTILVRGEYADDTVDNAEVALTEAKTWFDANLLKLNENKTKKLLVTTKNTTPNNSQKALKLLGVNFTWNLCWDNHINELCSRLATAVFSIRRLIQISTYEAARTAYFGCFESRATYSIMAWGTSSTSESVFKMQKQAIRALAGVSRLTSCRSLFKANHILTIPSLYILTCLKYIHEHPQKYTQNGELHTYGTRQRDQLAIPYHRIKKSQLSTNYWAVLFYNKLPHEWKLLNKGKFNAVIKKFLLSEEFYCINDFLVYQF